MAKVIIVNEDQAFCKKYQKVLEREGFEVEVFYDGKVGLTHTLATRPQLVILGLMLPTMNGFDVLKVLKEKETTRKIPVVVCSHLVTDGSEEASEAQVLGACAVFPKSTCTPKVLLRKVRHLLG